MIDRLIDWTEAHPSAARLIILFALSVFWFSVGAICCAGN